MRQRYRLAVILMCLLAGASALVRTAAPPPVPELPALVALGKLPRAVGGVSPDGSLLAISYDNGLVEIYSADGKLLKKLQGHRESATVAISSDLHYAATASSDGTARLWDLETGKELRVLGKAESDYTNIIFSPTGEQIAATSRDNLIWLWQVAGGEAKKTPCNITSYLAFAPDGKTVAASGSGELHLFNTQDLKEMVSDTAHGINFAAYLPDGKLISRKDDYIMIFDPKNMQLILEFDAFISSDYSSKGIKISQSGPFLVAWSYGQDSVAIWNYQTGSLLAEMRQENVYWAAFRNNGRSLLTYSDQLYTRDISVFYDTQKYNFFEAYYDGERDNYSRYISTFILESGNRSPLPFLGPKAGEVLVTLTDRADQTIEAVEVKMGDNEVFYPIHMNVGASVMNVQLKKVKSLEVIKIDENKASLKLTLLDGPTLQATMGTCNVTGRFAYGEFSVNLADIKTISFNFQYAEQKAEPQPTVEDAPYRAEVVDIQGNRLPVSDLRLGYERNGHSLPLYAGKIRLNLDFKFLRRIEVLCAVRGGVIAWVTATGDKRMIGYFSIGQVSGTTGLGDFTLDLDKLGEIVFK